MKAKFSWKSTGVCAAIGLALLLAAPAVAVIWNMAVVTSAGSKLADVPLTDLVKLCKGTQRTWPDGRSFTLVIRDPESADMRIPVQKLFGVPPAEAKALIKKLNEARATVKIVQSDQDLLRTVEATPGAIGVVDVYSIDSSVKVLRIDGKLPFDPDYFLRGH